MERQVAKAFYTCSHSQIVWVHQMFAEIEASTIGILTTTKTTTWFAFKHHVIPAVQKQNHMKLGLN